MLVVESYLAQCVILSQRAMASAASFLLELWSVASRR
jgi:hypothetical protein